MKTMKKAFAFLLAVVMVMGLGVTVFAEGETETAKGSITVKDAAAGETYTAYKIFDVTYSGNAYAYSISKDSAWLSTVQAYITQEGDEGITLTLSAEGNNYVVTTTDAFSAAAFAQYLNAALYGYTEVDTTTTTEPVDGTTYYVKNGNTYSKCVGLTAFEEGVTYYTKTSTELLTKVSGTALTYNENKKEASATVLDLGYYFVTSSVGSLANLTTTNPKVVIYDKNEVPSFDKKADDVDVEIGQTVNYTITGEVPSTTGYTTYTYKVSDTLSSGLTFNKDVKVKFEDTEIGLTTVEDASAVLSDSQIRYTDTGFELYFDMTKHQKDVDKAITITYSAVVNEDAVVAEDGNPNEAKLVYSNDPNDTSKTTTLTDEEKVYTVDLTIDKYAKNENDTSTKLSGAKFVLVKKDETTDTGTFYQATVSYTYETTENEKKVTVTVYSNDDGKNYYTDIACTETATIPEGTTPTKGKVADISWVGSIDDATVMITDENGAASFDGLEAGTTYYLRETEAPEGYNLLTSDAEVTINRTEDEITKTVTISGNTAKVANSTGSELPSTGGIGTTIFYVIGSILVIGAAVLLITKKRMNDKE